MPGTVVPRCSTKEVDKIRNVWRYSGDVAFVESAGRIYCLSLLDPNSRVVLLEGSSAEIWLLIPERSIDDIVSSVEARVGTGIADLRESVSGFVSHLHRLGLIVDA